MYNLFVLLNLLSIFLLSYLIIEFLYKCWHLPYKHHRHTTIVLAFITLVFVCIYFDYHKEIIDTGGSIAILINGGIMVKNQLKHFDDEVKGKFLDRIVDSLDLLMLTVLVASVNTLTNSQIVHGALMYEEEATSILSSFLAIIAVALCMWQAEKYKKNKKGKI